MKTFAMTCPALAIVAMLLAGCNGTGKPVNIEGATGTEPVPILAAASGSDPAIKADAYLINAADQTTANLAGLNANFDSQSIVVIGLGEMPTAGYEVVITGVQKKGDTLFVQFKVSKPGDVAAQVITYPYGAALIPKFVGKVSPEEETN
jgi:predicted small secreted protein